MADVRELVDRVRSKLTDEQRSEVGADLETIKSGFLEKVDEAKAAVAESMERKRKIRQSQEDLENLTIERDMWKTKFESHDDSNLIKERDTYKQKWNSYIDTQKDSFKTFYESAKDSEVWGKVANEYKIPDNDEWDKLPHEDIENNVSKMQYHKKLGLFDSQPTKPNPPTNKPFEFSNEKVPTPKEVADIMHTHGMNSPEFRRAKILVNKHEKGEI